MKKNFYFLSSLFGVAFLSVAVALACNQEIKQEVNAIDTAQQADVSRFYMRSYGGGVFTPDTTNQTITVTGSWDSSFICTDQFNTLSKKYSIGAHISSENIGEDGLVGFNLYNLYEDYMSFYLAFDATGVAMNNISFYGPYDEVRGDMRAALEGDPEFATYTSGFYSLWPDSGFTSNPLDLLISPVKGFDITFTIEDTEYLNTHCQAYSVKIDAYLTDGITPASCQSKKAYIDWRYKTKNVTVQKTRQAIKPQLGLYTNGITDLVYSNITFKDLTTDVYKTKVSTYGDPALIKTTVDVENQTIDINSSHACTSGVLLDTLNNDSQDFYIDADISGVGSNQYGVTVGFSLYYNDENTINYFLEWSPTLLFPERVTSHYIVNGAFQKSCRLAQNLWDDSLKTIDKIKYQDTNGEWYWNYTDWGGFATDSSFNCGVPVEPVDETNFNHFRQELTGTTQIISTGFKIGLMKNRVVRFGTALDEVVFKFTTIGNDGLEHNWYSCPLDTDAFTHPLGSETPSEFINTPPKIALYAFHNTEISSHVTFSNIKFNGHDLLLQAPTGLDVTDMSDKFMVGDKFEFKGKVTLKHNDSSVDRVLDSDEYEVIPPTQEQMNVAGTYDVIIKYLENPSINVTKQITVSDPGVLTDLELSTPKTNYKVGDTFEKPSVTAVYEGGTKIPVTNAAIFEGYDMDTAGTQSVKVKYTKAGVTIEKKYTIYVVANLTGISFENIKETYNVGDTFVKPTVKANYDGGKSDIDVSESSNLSFIGYDMNTAGSQTVTATYIEDGVTVTNTFNITVKEKLLSIKAVLPKTEYKVGDEFVVAGIEASYTGSTEKKNVTSSSIFEGYDMDTAGTQTVKVSYTENDVTVETSYTITVFAVLKEIVISNEVTEFKQGSKFVLPTVTAKYEKGKEDTDVTNLVSISGYKKDQLGKQTVIISYSEKCINETITKTVSLEVNVVQNTNIGLIVGASAGGVALLGGGLATFLILRKKHKKVL